jgi:DNA ligase (NAD+)
MRIRYAAKTDPGLKRNHNEDYFSLIEDEQLFLVADGMGGHACGEVACRFAMDVDQLGAVLVEKLVDEGLVRDVADLYDLTAETVTGLERMGKKSADNVVRSIAASKERTLDRLITGIGIEHVGQVASQQLAEAVGSLPELLAWTPDQARERVDAIHGFGPKMVETVIRFLFDDEGRHLLEKLAERGVSRPMPRRQITQGPLSGATFCVTGVLSRKREDVHAAIHAAGGEVHDKVKKDTRFLVAGEKVGKSKLDAAKKNGARVIDEPTLDLMIKGEQAVV